MLELIQYRCVELSGNVVRVGNAFKRNYKNLYMLEMELIEIDDRTAIENEAEKALRHTIRFTTPNHHQTSTFCTPNDVSIF